LHWSEIAARAPRLAPERRCDQQRDNADDDEQLDERKSATVL
jgi:hypothetical protein